MFEPVLPLAYWAVIHSFSGFALTIPLQWRFSTLPAFSLLATAAIQSSRHLPSGFGETWGIITFIGCSHWSSLLYLQRWTIILACPKDTSPGDSILQAYFNVETLKRIYSRSSDTRLLCSDADEVSGPTDLPLRTTSPARTPAFTFKRVAFLLTWWVIFVFVFGPVARFLNLSAHDFSTTHEDFLSRLHSEAKSISLEGPK